MMLIGIGLLAGAVKLLLVVIDKEIWGIIPVIAIQIIFLFRYTWICLWEKFLPRIANDLHALNMKRARKIKAKGKEVTDEN